MPTDVRQSSFASGEIDPELYGADGTGNGARLLRNFIVLPSGRARNRPGTFFEQRARNADTTCRLWPYVRPHDAAVFIIEFGDGYYWIRNGDGTPYEYAGSATAYAALTAYGDFPNDQIVSYGGNHYINISPSGGNTGNQPDISPTKWELIGGYYELGWTSYAEADLPRLRFAQNGQLLFIAHPSYPLAKIEWYFDPTAPPDYWVHTASVDATKGLNIATVTPSGGDTTGDADHPLRDWVYGATALYDVRGRGPEETAFLAASPYAVASSPDRDDVLIDTTQPAVDTNVMAHIYYKGRDGVYGFIGSSIPDPVTGNAQFKDLGLDPDFTKQPPTQTWPFGSANNYPAVVANFEARTLYARTNDRPFSLWGSMVGDYKVLDQYVPVADDNAIQFNIASNKMEEIRALVPARNLVLCTGAGEWIVNGAGDQPITPFTFSARRHSNYGCTWLEPIEAGGLILLMQARGNIVRALNFSNEAQGLADSNVSLLSQHLFRTRTVTYWDYAGEPSAIVWATTDDGLLLSLTLALQPAVSAWAWHDTDGEFENVITVPDDDGGEDAVWVVVKRTVDGSDVRYIERLAPRYVTDVDDFVFLDSAVVLQEGVGVVSGLDHLEDCEVYALLDGVKYRPFTVASGEIDLGLSTEGAWDSGTTYAAGLYAELGGETYLSLQVLDDDGEVVANLNKDPATETDFWKVATAVIGLPYVSDLELLDILPQKSRVKTVRKVTVEVEASRGLYVGETEETLKVAAELERRVSDDYGAPNLYTGVIQVQISSSWNLGGRVFLRQQDPLPLTILGVTREVELGGS